MRCPHCGFENETSARFCANAGCGRYLDRPAAPAAAPAAPPPPAATGPTGPAGPVPTAPPPGAPPGAAPAPVAPPVSPMAPPPSEPQAPPPPAAPAAPPAPAAPGAVPGAPVPSSTPPAAEPVQPQRVAEVRPGRAPAAYTFTRSRAEPIQVNAMGAVDGPDDLTPNGGSRSPDGRQGLFVVLEGGSGSVAAGSEHVARVKVSNTGSLVERVDLRAEGLPADWVTFEPPQVNLDQNAEQVVLLRIRPPRAAGTAAGQRPYFVQVWSLTNPAVNVVVRAALDVAPFAECTLTIDPMAGSTRKVTRFTAHLTNGGNQPLTATLRAGDQNGQVRVHPPQLDVTVPPGRPMPVELQVSARKRIWFGSQELHRVGVEVGAADTPLASSTVTFTQLPTLPRWTGRALPFVAIGVALLMVLGYQQWARVKPRPVPNVVNAKFADAKGKIEGAGFQVERKERASTAAKDVVIEQDPGATREGLPGMPGLSTVTLTVSAGAPDVVVQAVTDKTLEEAKAILKDFTVVNPPPEFNDDVPDGLIISQEPLPNVKAPSGSTVTVRISKGPRPKTMPKLDGVAVDKAQDQLRDLLLDVNTVVQGEPAASGPGTVTRQEPAAGSPVSQGQTVTIFVTPPAATTTTASTPAAPPP